MRGQPPPGSISPSDISSPSSSTEDKGKASSSEKATASKNAGNRKDVRSPTSKETVAVNDHVSNAKHSPVPNRQIHLSQLSPGGISISAITARPTDDTETPAEQDASKGSPPESDNSSS